jgi:hypothetical protein
MCPVRGRLSYLSGGILYAYNEIEETTPTHTHTHTTKGRIKFLNIATTTKKQQSCFLDMRILEDMMIASLSQNM